MTTALTDSIVHLVGANVGLKLLEVVDCALAVGGGNHMVRVLADFFGNGAPGSLDGGDRVYERAVLEDKGKGCAVDERGGASASRYDLISPRQDSPRCRAQRSEREKGA